MGEVPLGICGQIEVEECFLPGRDADSGPLGMMDETQSFSWGGGCERAGDQLGGSHMGNHVPRQGSSRSSNQTSLDTSQCNRQAAPGWALGGAPSKGFGMSCLSYNKGINLSLLGQTSSHSTDLAPSARLKMKPFDLKRSQCLLSRGKGGSDPGALPSGAALLPGPRAAETALSSIRGVGRVAWRAGAQV